MEPFQSTQPSQAVTMVRGGDGNEIYEFQSTQPSQAVTDTENSNRLQNYISIHTAFAGCDFRDYYTVLL